MNRSGSVSTRSATATSTAAIGVACRHCRPLEGSSVSSHACVCSRRALHASSAHASSLVDGGSCGGGSVIGPEALRSRMNGTGTDAASVVGAVVAPSSHEAAAVVGAEEAVSERAPKYLFAALIRSMKEMTSSGDTGLGPGSKGNVTGVTANTGERRSSEALSESSAADVFGDDCSSYAAAKGGEGRSGLSLYATSDQERRRIEFTRWRVRFFAGVSPLSMLVLSCRGTGSNFRYCTAVGATMIGGAKTSWGDLLGVRRKWREGELCPAPMRALSCAEFTCAERSRRHGKGEPVGVSLCKWRVLSERWRLHGGERGANEELNR